MQKRQTTKIVLFGRTGSGKSTLGNRLSGSQTTFQAGHTLISETSNTVSKSFTLVDAPSYQVIVIDTPGFADNRVDMRNEDLLGNILSFLKDLGDGFNIGIYCMSAKARVDAHDLEEFRLIGTLLGQEVFEHTFIAVTQVNMLEKEERAKVYRQFPIDLPRLLLENGIQGFNPEKILFSDFNNFKEKFVNPLTKIMDKAPLYYPQTSQDVDVSDPSSLKKFLAPKMQETITHYENRLMSQGKAIGRVRDLMIKQDEENAKRIKKTSEEVELYRNKLKDVNERLSESKRHGEKLERRNTAYREEQAEELRRLTEEIHRQEDNGVRLQEEIQRRENQIDVVTSFIPSSYSYRDNTDDDLWPNLLIGLATLTFKIIGTAFKS